MQFKNPTEYEISVKNFLEKHGFHCLMPNANMEGYYIITKKMDMFTLFNAKCLVKHQYNPSRKILDYLKKPITNNFVRGIFLQPKVIAKMP